MKNNERPAWAPELKDWTLNQWTSGLWSYDSTSKIFGSTRRVFVSRRWRRWYDGVEGLSAVTCYPIRFELSWISICTSTGQGPQHSSMIGQCPSRSWLKEGQEAQSCHQTKGPTLKTHFAFTHNSYIYIMFKCFLIVLMSIWIYNV